MARGNGLFLIFKHQLQSLTLSVAFASGLAATYELLPTASLYPPLCLFRSCYSPFEIALKAFIRKKVANEIPLDFAYCFIFSLSDGSKVTLTTFFSRILPLLTFLTFYSFYIIMSKIFKSFVFNKKLL